MERKENKTEEAQAKLSVAIQSVEFSSDNIEFNTP